MTKLEPTDSLTRELAISPRDIIFECPACRKSLVVDVVAEGMIVQCPQCRIDVIVPPKPTSALAPPPPSQASSKTGAVEEKKPVPAGEDLRSRLVIITDKLKELQTQRTEINNRLAARINDVNRDLVMMARLETSQQQVTAELNQLVAQIGTQAASGSANATAGGRSRVNLRS